MRLAEPDPAWPPRPPGWRHDAPDPPDAFPVPWSIGDATLMVAWTLIAQVLVGAALLVLPLGIDPLAGGSAAASVTIAAQLVTLGGILAWFAARDRLSWRLLGPLRPRVRDLLTGVGVGVAGFVIVTLSLFLVEQLAGRVEPPDQPLRDMALEGGLTVVLVVTAAVVLAPAIEELVFRGMLFQAIRARAGAFPAMGISALVFGAVHLPQVIEQDGSVNVVALPSIAALAILGFWFAAAFHRTGRLLVVIVGHATFNGTALLLLNLLGPQMP